MGVVDDLVSGFLTDEPDNVSPDTGFSEIEALPSPGLCDLYRAKRYGRWCLLKCLKETFRHDPGYQQMLRKEFDVLSLLRHPYVMDVIAFEPVELPDGSHAFALVAEWIDGLTLDQFLASDPPLGERRRVAEDLAETLAYVHSQQVVHRDLKPSNIMVSHNGHYVKLIDFGLADTDSHAVLKQPAGTLRYMAPEQMHLAVADVRNDIYSLGMVMQEMKLGGGNYARVVRRCLRPVDKRYQNMDALLADLHSHRHQRLIVSATAVAVIAVIALLLWQIRNLRHQTALQRQNTAALNLQLRVLNGEVIGFTDPAVKAKCVRHWDTDGDGELSFAEAAAVDSLGHIFTGDVTIESFKELEHFTGLGQIDAEAFRDCINLRAVRLPVSARFIRHDAFRHTGIEWFFFPGTVAGLSDHILEDCPRLETVVFESRLPDTNIGPESFLFVNCPRLTTIFVPTKDMALIRAGREILRKYDWVTILKIAGTTSFKAHRWRQYESVSDKMTDRVLFADETVRRICVSRWDRDGDHELSVSEAAAVRQLGLAFCGNSEITAFDELRFFTSLEEIPASAFEDCRQLRTVRLPNSVKTIGDWAFANCFSLTEIDMPDQLVKIGTHAFNTSDLHKVFIPAGTTDISSSAFFQNEHLTSVEVSHDNPVYDSRENCNAIIETATNRLLVGSVTAFIPRSVYRMSDEAFVGYHRDTLTLPAQLENIGTWAMSSHFNQVIFESPTPPYYNFREGVPHFIQAKCVCVPIGAGDTYRHTKGWERLPIEERPFAAPVSYRSVLQWPSPTPTFPLVLPSSHNAPVLQ